MLLNHASETLTKEMKNERLPKRKEGNEEENSMMIPSYKNLCDNRNNERLAHLNMHSGR